MLEKLHLGDNPDTEGFEEAPDEDTLDEKALGEAFHKKFYLKSEKAVCLQKNYVLHLAKSGNSLVAGLSRPQIQLLELTEDSLKEVQSCDFKGNDNDGGICGVRFLRKDPQVFLSGQTKGVISVHDKRRAVPVASLEDTTSGSRKPFTAFDVNSSDRVLCVGTEQILQNVFLLFFDLRQRKLLGGYWESHEDDVTSVEFHTKEENLLATGSTDGLINVFKISENTESDALDYSINTEKTVQRISWHKREQGDLLSSIMDSHDFDIYNTEDAKLLASFPRQKITERMLRKSSINCSTIGSHNTAGGIFLMTGSNFGDGECLRVLEYRDKELHPHADFIGNHQIVRSYVHDEPGDFYITGGENGIISLWSDQPTTPGQKSKAPERRKTPHKAKPY